MPPPPPLGVALRSGTADRVDISSPPVCWRSGTPSERAVSDRLQLSADHRKRKWAQRGGKRRLSWDYLILVTFSCIRQASVLRTAGSLGKKWLLETQRLRQTRTNTPPSPTTLPPPKICPLKEKASTHKEEETRGGCPPGSFTPQHWSSRKLLGIFVF